MTDGSSGALGQPSESRLIHLNRLYKFLSQANQTIVRARTREELFCDICRVAVEHCQVLSAGIGTLQPDSGRIESIAWWIREEGQVRQLQTSATEPDACDPWGCAFREGTRLVCNDLAGDSRTLSWREQAPARGSRSGAGLPIKVDGKMVGALTVFADRLDFFDEETLRLLDEVNSDISHALHAMGQEEQRRIAENEARRLNQELEQRVLERTSQLDDANSRLAKQNEELARASRMKSEFLARMSHEFRTPLNSIVGFTDLLAEEGEGPLGESYADYVCHVSEGANHLLALVNDILDLSRIEAGRIELRHEEFCAGDAISEVLSVTYPLAAAKKIEFRSEVAAKLIAYCDRTRFKQILYNLLSNAIKFTPLAGSVLVTAESGCDEIRFCVTDTGIGIPLEHQTVIFEEFAQVAPAAGGDKEGAGLGLTITKRIVELHDGRIWVESAPGKGSRFWFTVPAARAGGHDSRQSSNTA
ncbi:MAG TPA: GAF domain-containing sensor histidine kinase [Bryobacteraceae bacterium]|nr:GAF domain-containing sensor histidine kinase [Bryobacteraceae bacterium]